jgi:hypothetical protein
MKRKFLSTKQTKTTTHPSERKTYHKARFDAKLASVKKSK